MCRLGRAVAQAHVDSVDRGTVVVRALLSDSSSMMVLIGGGLVPGSAVEKWSLMGVSLEVGTGTC